MAEGQSKLPWVLLAVAIGGAVGAGVLASQQAEEARGAKEQADAAWDSAGTLLAELEERNERLPVLVDSINAYWQDALDSITVPPPEVPVTEAWVEALLDTAQVTQALRAGIEAVRTERDSLRSQNTRMRQTITDLRLVTRQAIDSVNAFWQSERARDLEVIASLRTAAEKSREEANRWEAAYYASRMSWTDKLTWGLGGAAVGYLANEFTGSDVRVDASCDCPPSSPTFVQANFKSGAR